MPTRVQVIHEVRQATEDDVPTLCLQWCQYVYEDGWSEHGYRFIWRRENGNLQPARGQARIPSIKVIEELVAQAKRDGWGDKKDEP